jgi:hypothetical protein
MPPQRVGDYPLDCTRHGFYLFGRRASAADFRHFPGNYDHA